MPLIYSINGFREIPFVEPIGSSEKANIESPQQKTENPQDRLELSQKLEELKYINNVNVNYNKEIGTQKPAQNEPQKSSSAENPNEPKKNDGSKLSEEEKQKVEELKKIDQKVRAHEMAHQAAGAGLVRGTSFNYTVGPDGKQYAIGGEVKIDISPVPGDPEATIQKMQQVRRAALAPSDPSPQDRSVANLASNIESKARAELNEEKANESKKVSGKLLNSYKNSEKTPESQIGKNIDYSNIAEPYASLRLQSTLNKFLQKYNSPYLLD